MTLFVWTIALPSRDNAGNALHMAHKNFRAHLLNTYGGYTEGAPASGVWRDEQDGVVFRDHMTPYSVAFSDTDGAPDLVGPASRLFPDQRAFFVTGPVPAEIMRAERPTLGEVA